MRHYFYLKKTINDNISSIDWSVRSPKEYSFAKRFTGMYLFLKINKQVFQCRVIQLPC